jgi:aminoglycoside N3'-acetyltransferase
MGEHGGKTLLLGTAHSTNSSIHLIAEFGGSEYKMQDKAYWLVTVKEFLKLSRKEQAAMLVPHLGGNLSYGLDRHYDSIDEPLKKAGAIRFGKIGNAEVRLMKIADLVRVGLEEVKRDPCFLVSKVSKP